MSIAILLKVSGTSDLFDQYREERGSLSRKVAFPSDWITAPAGNLLYQADDYLKTEERILVRES